ncbi:predicted protein [Chaetomium globosum CBS 148.51]|uniref:Uncharacterized protein n=1 Tax=Chaetomium globosum (strain ATCC 6205 / CBS 148.51 / DSM 1962 / NBRC 6347 / NRRL 1970) TaxID=306901 RepID=Q2HCL5_CHAGB|nr:uncharacterized protein CHGG_02039 [Chaetomium globosum CBS 148.51]EAQ93804.1 predicted protein [Chaetomium globosum CBS 148.51]
MAEDAACIPAVWRTMQSWVPVLPWDKPADGSFGILKSPVTWDLVTGYHMHETTRALHALPGKMRRFAGDCHDYGRMQGPDGGAPEASPSHSIIEAGFWTNKRRNEGNERNIDAPLLVQGQALELAQLMQQLGDWEEKGPGVAGGMGGSVSVVARIGADLDAWAANGPGPAEVRRHRVAATRLRQSLHKLKSRVVVDMDELGDEISAVLNMASMVRVELEHGSKSPEWMGCNTCKDHVFSVLQKAANSLREMARMLNKYSTDLGVLLYPDDINVPGPLDIRRGPVNLHGFRRTTDQASDLAQLMGAITKQVSHWGELINDVQHGFREWEVFSSNVVET